jgi:hypothetical protein
MASIQQVSVHYRHVELQSGAQLQETDDGGLFLALAEPPPVRTVLELRETTAAGGGGNARGHAYEITGVVEVESPGGARGCRLRRVDDEALKSRTVGSERLADASGGRASPTGAMPAARSNAEDGEDWSDEYGAHMAVPAPVVDPDGGDDSGETTESSDTTEPGGDDGDEDAAASSTDSGESRPGKKRRGRKRK